MSNEIPLYDTGGAVPQTIAAFRNRPCSRPFADAGYRPPTPEEVRALIKLGAWSQTDAARLVGANVTPGKGSTTIRKWQTKKDAREARAIPYAAWRLLLLAAGVVTIDDDVVGLRPST